MQCYYIFLFLIIFTELKCEIELDHTQSAQSPSSQAKVIIQKVFSQRLYQKNVKINNNNHSRPKRFLSLMSRQPNKNDQECVMPIGTRGHCKHIHHCVLTEFRQNFWRILDYLCIIERSSIGICCPDELSEKPGPSMPIVDDNSSPIWSEDNDLNVAESEKTVNKPEERGCGLSTKSIPKITGGRPADPSEWPWMAAILGRGPASAFCGGVIITDRHVLTAAHCTHKFETLELFVRLGEYDFRVYNETRSRDFRVVDIRQHIDFDATTYENDIAILKLHQVTVFNSYIWPVCMPPADEAWEGYTGIVTGWGTQFLGGPNSDVLMEVSIPIWNQERCKEAFLHRVTKSVICAGTAEGGRDSCQGDSGGPLLVQIPNKRWVVVGIVSWGIGCGQPNYPGIYTRVNAYTQWILENSAF